MKSFLNKNHSWINPIVIILTTGSAALITYDLSDAFISMYPIKSAVIQPILSYIGLVFWPSLIFLGYITYCDAINRKTLNDLRKEIDDYEQISETLSENIKELFNGFLYKFATSKLNFRHTERVTLYIHDGNKTFIPFGRFSLNTSFSKKGRTEYPDDVGCISKGWENGWHFYKCEFSPLDEEAKYTSEQKKLYSLDKKVVDKINMKSSVISVLRLNKAEKPIAVIVVESINENKYDEDELRESLESQHEYLSHMISSLQKYIPKPSAAKTIEGA